jgi:hypothetical protein
LIGCYLDNVIIGDNTGMIHICNLNNGKIKSWKANDINAEVVKMKGDILYIGVYTKLFGYDLKGFMDNPEIQ